MTGTQTTEQKAPAAAPAAEPQTQTPPPAAPSAEPKEKTPSEKMADIVAKKAGAEPPKTEEPEKSAEPPSQTAEPKTQEPKKTDSAAPQKKKSAQEIIKRLKSEKSDWQAKLAEAQSKIAELEAKAKTGELTEVEQLRGEQLLSERDKMIKEQETEYHIEAAEALGDSYEDFAENNKYYTPDLNQNAPDFASYLSKMDNKFKTMSVLFEGFNEGTVDYKKFVELPLPRQIAFIRKLQAGIEAVDSGQPPAAPAAQAAAPPKVPNPQDADISSPSDKNAMMARIVHNKAKYL